MPIMVCLRRCTSGEILSLHLLWIQEEQRRIRGKLERSLKTLRTVKCVWMCVHGAHSTCIFSPRDQCSREKLRLHLTRIKRLDQNDAGKRHTCEKWDDAVSLFKYMCLHESEMSQIRRTSVVGGTWGVFRRAETFEAHCGSILIMVCNWPEPRGDSSNVTYSTYICVSPERNCG